ncbi:MAG: MFS transporter [Candidatus Rokubacteria bacterium]|nr:MFS transporter [Candidatus Rokubacteria bacterium]
MIGTADGSGNRWVALAVLTFARTAMGFQFQSVGAVSPLLMERLHIANTELGWLIGLFSLPGVFLALPGGLLGGRFGDRRVVFAGLGLMTLGSALMGAAEGFAAVAVGRLLSAVGAILLNVLLTKMVTDWFAGREIIWAMTVLINSWPVGIGLASLTLPVVANAWGVSAVFHVAAGAAAVGAVGIALLYKPAPRAAMHAKSIGLTGLSRRETGLVSLASVPWMLYNVGYALMLGFVPSLLVRGGLSVEQAGLVLGLSTLLFIGSALLGGASAQWLARPDVVVTLGLLAFTGGLVVLPYAPPWPTLIAVGLLAGLPAGTLAAAPTAVLRPESRGAGMGLFYTAYYVGMALLPPVAGWLQDVLGRSAALYFAAAAVLAALPFYVAFRAMSKAREGPIPGADRARQA